MEHMIQLHIEKLPEGVYLATKLVPVSEALVVRSKLSYPSVQDKALLVVLLMLVIR